MRTPKFLVTTAAALTLACGEDRFRDPVLPEGSIVLEPIPTSYVDWWLETQQCSGLTGDFNRIRWFQLPEAQSFYIEGSEYFGYWWETHWILLAGAHVDEARLVRHEMLHDLLYRTDHPTEFFETKCGDLV